MFENILTKNSVSFKDLEEIAFKIACERLQKLLTFSYNLCIIKIGNDKSTNVVWPNRFE